MTRGLEPTEEYDGSIEVRLLYDRSATEVIRCGSYEDAIEVVKNHRHSATTAKIIHRDDTVVFTSADMCIEDWETEWEHAKRSLSVDIEKYDCPYENVACFADDLCVQCKMDKVQSQS